MPNFNVDQEVTSALLKLLPKNYYRILSASQIRQLRLGYIDQEFNFLQRSQWFKLRELKNFQLKKLKQVVWYAYNNIPLYKRKFKKARITPSDIKSLEDVSKIPILSKDEVKKNFQDIIPPKGTIYRVASTSGSTGKPLRCLLSIDAVKWRDAILQRTYMWAGCDPAKDKIMGIAFPPSFTGAFINTKSLVFRGLKYLISNRLHWTPKVLDTKELLKIFYAMTKFQPKLIRTFPYIILYLSEIQDHFDVTFPKSLRCITLTGEGYPKKIIQKLVDAEVFNHYGAAAEVGTIASECKQNGLHIHMENHIVEVVKNNEILSNGEKGEVVITDFTNFDMPLIRYNIEDISSIENDGCSCGRKLTMLEEVHGRKSDLLVSKDGKIITDIAAILQAIDTAEGGFNKAVNQFRVIQEKIDKITLVIVPTSLFSEKTKKVIVSRVKNLLGNDVEIKVKLVDKISHGRKFRHVVSNVNKKLFES